MKNKILLIFICSIILLLTSCTKQTINNKIIYNKDKIEYDISLREYSSSTFYNLVYKTNTIIFKGQNSVNLNKICSKITDLLLSFGVNENDYVELLDYIKDNTDDIVEAYNNEDYKNPIIEEFISKFTKLFGFNNIITFIYDFTVYYFDFMIEDYKKSKNSNPNLANYYDNKIKEKESDKEIFLSIDKNEFNKLIKSSIMILKLLKSDLTSDINSLSNDEIELFISKLDLKVNLTSEQYKVLFKILKDLNIEKDLMNKIINSSNFNDITSTINMIFSLFDSIIKKTNKERIDIYKNNDENEIIKEVLTSFDNIDRDTFNSIFELKLDETYLDYFNDYIDINKLKDLENLDANEIFNDLEGDNLTNLYRVIRKVFYD